MKEFILNKKYKVSIIKQDENQPYSYFKGKITRVEPCTTIEELAVNGIDIETERGSVYVRYNQMTNVQELEN